MRGLTIFIGVGQSITRAGIAAIIAEQVDPRPSFMEFTDKESLFTRLQTMQPEVLILDFDFLDLVSAGDLSRLRISAPYAGILAIITDQSQDQIHAIIDRGVTGCILISCEKQELVDAVTATADKRKYFCSGMLDLLFARKTILRKPATHTEPLTPAEQEIVMLIAQGLTSKEIAERKKLSYHTIITHRKNIFRKLAIKNSTELMLHAMNTGMIEAIDYSI
jgi:two-component system, NarL family, invasion response regulator UvrY